MFVGDSGASGNEDAASQILRDLPTDEDGHALDRDTRASFLLLSLLSEMAQ
jgi:hypothetical protein